MKLQSPEIKAFLRKFMVVALPLWMIYMAFLPVVPPVEKEVLLAHLSNSFANGEITIQASYDKQGAAYAKAVSKQEFVELLCGAVLIKYGYRITHGLRVADLEFDTRTCHIEMTVYEDLGKTGLYICLSSSGGLQGDIRFHLLDATPMMKLLGEP
ncbi:hypothetical protein BH11VER1_BH11VER1_26560 [soil metagenome]